MKDSIKFVKSYVFITTHASLDDIAKKISMALSINLEKAQIGRFEEYTGYQCDVMGLTVFLLGEDPFKPPEEVHTYELSVRPSEKLRYKDEMPFDEIDISTFFEWVLMSRMPDLKISRRT